MLEAQKVRLIQESFARVAPIADDFAADFYARLFKAHPAVRALFPTEMTPQREKLVATLAFVVKGLGRLDSILAAVKDLGVRHLDYKAERAHYQAVGAALIGALQAKLGPHWTPEFEAAWQEAYSLLARTMLDAAAERAPVGAV